jgi:hypothetical protein
MLTNIKNAIALHGITPERKKKKSIINKWNRSRYNMPDKTLLKAVLVDSLKIE